MAQYTIQSKYASLVAIDQHARSVTLCGLDLTTGEERVRQLTNCPSAADIAAWATSWATVPIRFAYESGPCGFQLARDMADLGYRCDIIAVTSIARSSEDKRQKDDRRDAARLLAELACASPRCKVVWIPPEQSESDRDLVRTYYDAMDAVRRAKLQMSGFLLRHGYVWNERTARGALKKTWTRNYVKWVESLEFKEPSARATRDCYLAFALGNIARVRELGALCRTLANSERYSPYTDALTRLKGIDEITAVTFIVTMGDFSRFKNGRSVSAYFGLTPSRHDSGERSSRGGHVTKAGDTTCRHAVVEALSGISRYGRGAKVLLKGRQPASARIEAEALKCNARNVDRYRHLISCGKPHNVAKVAVASELVCDMWIIGLMVKEELMGR